MLEATPEGALWLFSAPAGCAVSALQQNRSSAFSNTVFFTHGALMKNNSVFPIVGVFLYVVYQIPKLDIGLCESEILVTLFCKEIYISG